MFNESINSAIKLSTKMIFLFGVGDHNKHFMDNDWTSSQYKNIKLYIGAIDNTITPFESTGSFQNDVRMFYALSNTPYTATTYKPFSLNNTTEHILEHQYRGINNINNVYNYMYHTTIVDSEGKYTNLLSYKDNLNVIKFNYMINANMYGNNISIEFVKVLAFMLDIWNGDEADWNNNIENYTNKTYKKYFNGTLDINDIVNISNLCYQPYNDETIKYNGINREGKFTSVLVEKPREYVDNVNFTYNIEKQWELHEMMCFTILNVGLLFNEYNIYTDEIQSNNTNYLSAHNATYSFPTLYNIGNVGNTDMMRLSMFNYNLQQTVSNYVDLKTNTNTNELINVIPGWLADSSNPMQDINDIKDIDNNSYIQYIRNKVIDYVELCTDEDTSLIVLLNNEDTKNISNLKYADEFSNIFNEKIVGKRSFVVSEYNKDVLNEYNTNCNEPYINISTFNIIKNENGISSKELLQYGYSVSLDDKLLYEFGYQITDVKRVAPLNTKYVNLPLYSDDIIDEYEADGYQIMKFNNETINKMTGFTTDWLRKGETYDESKKDDLYLGFQKIVIEDGLLTLTYVIDIYRICKVIYKNYVEVYRKCYAENFLQSELLYTIVAMSENSPINQSNDLGIVEYSVEHIYEDTIKDGVYIKKTKGDLAYVLDANRFNINSYENRLHIINQLGTRIYYIGDSVKPDNLICYNDKTGIVLKTSNTSDYDFNNTYITFPANYLKAPNNFIKFNEPVDIAPYYNNLYNNRLRYKYIDNDNEQLAIKIFTK